MGGTLSNIFKGGPALQTVSSGSSIPLFGDSIKGPSGPSTFDKMASAGFKGALDNFGQPQPSGPTSGPQFTPGPAQTPVDPAFFQPVNYQQNPQSRSAFYGGGA